MFTSPGALDHPGSPPGSDPGPEERRERRVELEAVGSRGTGARHSDPVPALAAALESCAVVITNPNEGGEDASRTSRASGFGERLVSRSAAEHVFIAAHETEAWVL